MRRTSMLSRRQLDILIKLMDADKMFSGDEIAKLFDVNVRTIRSDIQKINDYLLPFDIRISSSNKFGYRLEKENIKKLHNENIFGLIKMDEGFDLPQTPNERLSYLCFLLSKKESYSIEELADLLFLSIPSVYQDIHVITDVIIKKFNGLSLLHTNGNYSIGGSEADKRNMISGIICQRYNRLLENKYAEYIAKDEVFIKLLYQVIEVISKHHASFSYRLSGEGLYSLATDIALSYIREQQHLLLQYERSTFSQEFHRLKDIVCVHIPCLKIMREENWWFLQTRFYSKSFLVNPHQSYFTFDKSEKLLKKFQLYVKEKHNLRILEDDKSNNYFSDYIRYIFQNETHHYYWNAEDKDSILDEHVFCYVLALEFASILKAETSISLHKASLAIITLILKESYMRNKRKKRGLLISNKDKAHTVYYINKIVNELWTCVDLIEQCTVYDIKYNIVNANDYDTIISTETLEDYGVDKYLKISLLCNDNDIRKIQEALSKEAYSKANIQYQYRSLIVFYNGSKINELLPHMYDEVKKRDIYVDPFAYEDDVESKVYLHLNHSVLSVFSPFVTSFTTILFQISLHQPILYKKKEITQIKFIVMNPTELDNVHVLLK